MVGCVVVYGFLLLLSSFLLMGSDNETFMNLNYGTTLSFKVYLFILDTEDSGNIVNF